MLMLIVTDYRSSFSQDICTIIVALKHDEQNHSTATNYAGEPRIRAYDFIESPILASI